MREKRDKQNIKTSINGFVERKSSYSSRPAISTNNTNRPAEKRVVQERARSTSMLNSALTLFSAVLLVFSILTQLLLPHIAESRAQLSPQMYNLTGESRDDTPQFLELTDDGGYRFAATVDERPDNSVHTGRNAGSYEAYAPKDPKDGVTITETNSKIAVTLIPDFPATDVQKVDGDHLVYTSGPNKLVYTLKYNGMKEDIIIPEYQKDNLSYDFTLRLPAGVEARLQPDGSIGIFSSDPALFGDISYGSDEDRAKIEKARMNGEKNNMVMSIPYPVIKDANNQTYTDNIQFKLGDKTTSENEDIRPDLPKDIPRSMVTNNDYTLTIEATNLKDLTYPISLDPTMQVNDANDFDGVTNESGIDIDMTNAEIRRSSLTGGGVDAWSTDNTDSLGSGTVRSTVYNGKLYVLKSGASIYYADINASTGDVGSFTSSISALNAHKLIAYNGYLYQLGVGGSNNHFSKINESGSLEAATSTTSWAGSRSQPGVVIHAGYIYRIGGYASSTYYADSEYAPINSDGSIGSWTSSTSLNIARRYGEVAVYNNKIYIVAGTISGSTTGTIEYATINDDASLSTWTQSSESVANRFQHGVAVAAGYLYVLGGWDGTANSGINTTTYFEIFSDGSLGSAKETSNFTTARRDFGTALHLNRIYLIAGKEGDTTPVDYSNIEMTDIELAGELDGYTSAGNMGSAPKLAGSAGGIGFLYDTGGCSDGSASSTSCANRETEVRYATIQSDKTLSWSSTTALPTARWAHQALVHNGYLYILGGCTGLGCTTQTDILYADIDESDGTIGSWSTATASVEHSHNFSVVGYGDYIYTIGGSTANGTTEYNDVDRFDVGSSGDISNKSAVTNLPATNSRKAATVSGNVIFFYDFDDVYYNEIQSDGTLGSWTLSGSTATSGNLNELYAHNGYLYYHNSSNIHYTKIKSDNTIGSWTQTDSITQARQRIKLYAHAGALYVYGGCTNQSGYVNVTCDATTLSTEYAHINNGGTGSLSSYTVDSGGNFANSRKLHATVAYNDYLYVLGGCINATCGSSGDSTSIVSYAPINPDGTIGTWANVTTYFGGPRMRLMAFAYNDRMYIMGGRTYEASGQDLDDIRYAPIDNDGDISTTWTVDDTDLPGGSGHFGGSMVRYGGTVYFTGGGNGSAQDDVFYSVINESTGDMSAWTETTSRPTTSRFSWLAVYAGHIYSFGGHLPGTNEAYSAEINSDGTIGSWNQITSLPVASYSNSSSPAFALNGYMYIIYDIGPSNIPLTYYASIEDGGIINEWQLTEQPDYSNSNAYINFSTATYNGKAYVTGGDKQGGGGACDPCNQTTFSSLQSIPRKGSFIRRYNFESGVKPTKLITRGTKKGDSIVSIEQSSNATCSNAAYDNSQSMPGIAYSGGSNAQDIDIGTSRTLAQCMIIRYSFDDSQSAVFPDDGGESTITSFDLYFHPNPGSRLRGGRSFINGQDRGLDAAPD